MCAKKVNWCHIIKFIVNNASICIIKKKSYRCKITPNKEEETLGVNKTLILYWKNIKAFSKLR